LAVVTHESKQRILAAAKELFLARGYAATTVDAICERARLTKGSFYHFFDSKEELGLAVLDWSLQRSGQILSDGPHSQVADPVERALTFIDHIADSSPELWSGGCLLGAFALELAETNARMQKAVSGLFQAVTDNFAGMLEPLIAHTEGKERLTAHELADQLLGTLEGSIVLAKAHRDPSRIPKAIRAFRLAMTNLNAPVA
jgi:TetR/AcrR family transcriptional regulator, transcriptional repressor for nem operon